MGDVEPKARYTIIAALIVLVAITLLGGCVETAECNATVSCPDQQVCYEYTCREVCETQQDCAAAESCTPCMPAGTAGEGACFGEELDACVPEDE